MARRYHDVMRDLVDAVVAGRFEAGGSLPAEAELALRFGCGRGTIREALRGLEERGLVAARPARPPRVRDRAAWDLRDPEVLAASIAHGPESAVLAHAIDARAAVEREAAARAIRHATEGDLRLLTGHVDAMIAVARTDRVRTPGAGDPFVVAETWFHHVLGLLSDNPVLAKLAEPLHLVLAGTRHRRAPQRERAVVQHHRRILEGLAAREPELTGDAIAAYARALTRWLVTDPR